MIAMAILNHVDATAEERAAYLKQASALRRSEGAEEAEVEAATPTPRPRKSSRATSR